MEEEKNMIKPKKQYESITFSSKEFKILKILGSGAYGEIYQIEDPEGNKYALKKIKLINGNQTIRFDMLREPNFLKYCENENLVNLYEVSFINKNQIALLMEYCDCDLIQFIERFKSNHLIYNEKTIKKISYQIIKGVEILHSNLLFHRDLKPQNILFCDESSNSQIKVVDFGIGKIFDPSLTNLQSEINNSENNHKLKKMDSTIGTMYFFSPEVIKGSYSEKCDIWSLGIILYFMLCGYPPFSGENDNQLIQNILNGKLNFPKTEWKNISDSAKDLISKMLCPEKKRLSAKEIMNQKWFKSKLKNQKINLISFDFTKLNNYKNFNTFKKCVLLFLASRLNPEQYNEIGEIFRKIDECKNGTINFDDFKIFIINNQDQEIMGGELDEEIKKKFFEIDIDKNNKIDFTEFLAANMSKSIYKNKEKLRVAFDIFDTDKNGIISKEDIINILKMENLYDAKKLVSDLIEPNDINHDGKIDFEEFCKLMD